MSKPIIKIHNVETNEIIEREMTDEEYETYESSRADQVTAQSEQAAKDAARQAVLDKLGLTSDEIAALLG